MIDTILLLLITAAVLGFFHTTVGPDHYLPFIVISKARKWKLGKTIGVTIACGIGHVLSSVLIGFIGIALGVAVAHLEGIESFRAQIASWALIAFGLIYMVWGLRKAYRNKPHSHLHYHRDGFKHSHVHRHDKVHIHVHQPNNKEKIKSWKSLTPWVLFTIFVFGPCEPLIPLVMYPAAIGSMWGVLAVVLIFSITTITTMTIIVIAAYTGLSKIKVKQLDRYSHALAGLAIFLSGIAITLLGL